MLFRAAMLFRACSVRSVRFVTESDNYPKDGSEDGISAFTIPYSRPLSAGSLEQDDLPMKGQKVDARDPADRPATAGDDEVRRWRRQQLQRMGFSPADSSALSESPAELAAVRDLLARGCTPATATRILL
jgi:hypothetical protein